MPLRGSVADAISAYLVTTQGPMPVYSPGRPWPLELGTSSFEPCWKVEVLDDFDAGWPGRCSGLELRSTAAGQTMDQLLCKQGCSLDARCSVWVLDHLGQCWWGQGDHCQGPEDPSLPRVVGAQRLQHGDIRVLDSNRWEVYNLLNVGTFANSSAQVGTISVDRCKSMCYSDIQCTYWMYGQFGCWVERSPGNLAQDPLLPGGAVRDSIFAKAVRKEEHIQHYCPEQSSSSALATPLPVAVVRPLDAWRVWAAAAVTSALAVVVCGALCCSMRYRRLTGCRYLMAAPFEEESPVSSPKPRAVTVKALSVPSLPPNTLSQKPGTRCDSFSTSSITERMDSGISDDASELSLLEVENGESRSRGGGGSLPFCCTGQDGSRQRGGFPDDRGDQLIDDCEENSDQFGELPRIAEGATPMDDLQGGAEPERPSPLKKISLVPSLAPPHEQVNSRGSGSIVSLVPQGYQPLLQ